MNHSTIGVYRMERRPNWTEEEVKTLQSAVADRRHILYSRQIATYSMHKKKEAWKEIAMMVQSVGRADRNAHECRRKYADFTSRLRKKVGAQRRSNIGFGYQRPPLPRLRAVHSLPLDDEKEVVVSPTDTESVVPIKIECNETAQWAVCSVNRSHSPMKDDSDPVDVLPAASPPPATDDLIHAPDVSCFPAAVQSAEFVDLERKRLQVEQERLFVERERLVCEKQTLSMAAQRLSVEQQMLIVQQERLAVERERLALETQQLAMKAAQR